MSRCENTRKAAAGERAGFELANRTRDDGETSGRSYRSLNEPDRREQAAREAVTLAQRIVMPLSRSFPALDRDDIADAVSCALVDWCRAAEGDDPPDPGRVLYGSAWRNARDANRSAKARIRREQQWSVHVEHTQIVADEQVELKEDLLRRIHDLLPDEQLRTVFHLRLRGERRTDAFVEALRLAVDDPAKARQLVKREKDRLDKFLRRSTAIRAIAARIMSND